MHNNSYSINIACCCNQDFINSLEEIKSFFGFNIIYLDNNFKDLSSNKYNAVIIDSHLEKKISLEKISIPKIFIQNKSQNKIKKLSYELILKLPIGITKFNKAVIDLCKKYEFKKNSLIKIKEYILDKNERVLKKGDQILKITEKEIYFIDILNSSKKPLSKNYILKNIWSYSSDTDTHTIETHIYRLRQKIKKNFGDNNFIKNSIDGYSL